MTSIQKKNALKKKIFLTAILIVVFGCMTAIAFGETYMALMFCRIGIYTIAVSGLDILFGYQKKLSRYGINNLHKGGSQDESFGL